MYLPFYDPVTIPLVLSIWAIVEILSTGVSFAAVKLKLYERKSADSIRQELSKINKYLKKTELSEYTSFEAVKDYFMVFNRQWIVDSLDNIFSK